MPKELVDDIGIEVVELPASGTERTKSFEGWRDTIYDDGSGNASIGYGFNLADPFIKKNIHKSVLSGERPLSREEGDYLFYERYKRAEIDARQFLGKDVFENLDQTRKDVVVDMAYNMGYERLSGFKNLKSALQNHDYDKAAEEIMDSDYFRSPLKGLRKRAAMNVRDMAKTKKSFDLSELFGVPEASAQELPGLKDDLGILERKDPSGGLKDDLGILNQPARSHSLPFKDDLGIFDEEQELSMWERINKFGNDISREFIEPAIEKSMDWQLRKWEKFERETLPTMSPEVRKQFYGTDDIDEIVKKRRPDIERLAAGEFIEPAIEKSMDWRFREWEKFERETLPTMSPEMRRQFYGTDDIDEIVKKRRPDIERLAAGEFGVMRGLTFGALPDTEIERDLTAKHQTANMIGRGVGEVGSLLLTGGLLRAVGLPKIAVSAGMKASQYWGAALRYVPRGILTGATFGTKSLIEETVKQVKSENIDFVAIGMQGLKDTAFGTALGAIGGFQNAPLSVAGAFGLGYLSVKIEGGTNADAILSGAVLATFELVSGFGRNRKLNAEAFGYLERTMAETIRIKNPGLTSEQAKELSRSILAKEANRIMAEEGARRTGKTFVAKGADGYNAIINDKKNALRVIEALHKRLIKNNDFYKRQAGLMTTEVAPKRTDFDMTKTEANPPAEYTPPPTVSEAQKNPLAQAVVDIMKSSGVDLAAREQYVKRKVEGYEDLYIERISDNEIAVAHTYEKNGDLMLDPEIVFKIEKDGTLTPQTFEQSDLATGQQKISPNDPFFKLWADNLRTQGFIFAPEKDPGAIAMPAPEKEKVASKIAKSVVEMFPEDEVVTKLLKDEIMSGEAGKRIRTEDGDWIGVPSSFPDYFKNKGYTKKQTVAIIEKVQRGEPLTEKQKEIYDDLKSGIMAEIEKTEALYDEEIARAAEELGYSPDEIRGKIEQAYSAQSEDPSDQAGLDDVISHRAKFPSVEKAQGFIDKIHDLDGFAAIDVVSGDGVTVSFSVSKEMLKKDQKLKDSAPEYGKPLTEDEMKSAIDEGGGNYKGIQKGLPAEGDFPELPDIVYFDDPETGSTLALKKNEVSAENVRKRIASSREEFRAAEEAKKKPKQPKAGGLMHDFPESLKKKGVKIEDFKGIFLIDNTMDVKDVHGNKVELPEGEEYRAFELTNGQILLQDGKQVVVTKNQFQNVKGQQTELGEKPSEVKEVWKGEKSLSKNLLSKEELRSDIESLESELEKEKNVAKRGELQRLLDEREADLANLESGNTAKFSQYQAVKGGENYRELLLQVPSGLPSQYKIEKHGQYYIVYEGRQAIGEGLSEAEAINNASTRRDIKPQYKSPHFDEPNVVAHVRMSDFTTSDGKKVLQVQEIQSDWAREGREKGFKVSDKYIPKDEFLELQKNAIEALRRNDILGFDNVPDAIKAVLDHPDWEKRWEVQSKTDVDIINKFREAKFINQDYANKVPFHPAVKNWKELSARKILEIAVREGYDYVALPTGEQTAELYDLSKRIGEINWHKTKTPDGYTNDVRVVAVTPDKGTVVMDETVPIEKLDQYVGKDVANKIIKDEGKTLDTKYNASGTLSGLDLKAGGEWAKSLYDVQIPKEFKRLGAEVSNIQFKTPETLGQNDRLRYEVYDPQGRVYDAFPTLELAQNAAKDAGEGYTVKSPDKLLVTTQPAIKITPHLKRKIIGQPIAGGMLHEGGLPFPKKESYPVTEGDSDYYRMVKTSGGNIRILKGGAGEAITNSPIAVKFKKQGYVTFPSEKISSPADIAFAFNHLKNESVERAYLIGLRKGKIVVVEPLHIGTISYAPLTPFEAGATLHRFQADEFYLVHNHPGGDPKASPEDVSVSRTMKKTLGRIGVTFKGHVIINDTKFGFISPDGTPEIREHAKLEGKKKIPYVTKYNEWDSEKLSFPQISNEAHVFEITKGLQRDMGNVSGFYLLSNQLRIYGFHMVPQSQINVSEIALKAINARAGFVIAVNTGLSNKEMIALATELQAYPIKMIDIVEIDKTKSLGFFSAASAGVLGESEGEYLTGKIKESEPEYYSPTRTETGAYRQERNIQQPTSSGDGQWDVVVSPLRRIHDYIFTFGKIKRIDPLLYDKLSDAYKTIAARVETAINDVKSIVGNRYDSFERAEITFAVEEKSYQAPERLSKTVAAIRSLMEEVEKTLIDTGVFKQGFIESRSARLQEMKAKLENKISELESVRSEFGEKRGVSRRIAKQKERLAKVNADIEQIADLNYITHRPVARAVIEEKLKRMKKGDRETYLANVRNISYKYKHRVGVKPLRVFYENGLLKKEDIDIFRLLSQVISEATFRLSMRELFSYFKDRGYILHKNTKQENVPAGYTKYSPITTGMIASEYENYWIHPLAYEGLLEIKRAMTTNHNPVSVLFAMVKMGQFYNPGIIWGYDFLQMAYGGSLGVKTPYYIAKAFREVKAQGSDYNKFNNFGVFQQAYLPVVGGKSEADMIEYSARQTLKDLPIAKKVIENLFQKPIPRMQAYDLILNAYRAVSRATWDGDKILRLASVYAFKDMGYSDKEAAHHAGQIHGAYMEISPSARKHMSFIFFVHSFRILMPRFLWRIVYEPTRMAYEKVFEGKSPDPRDVRRASKGLAAAVLIPFLYHWYYRARGYKTEVPLWKYYKTVEGGYEVVAGINSIISQPIKWAARVLQYDPLNPEPRAIQGVKNFMRYEQAPIYRIIQNINENKKSFGGGRIYDPNDTEAKKLFSIAKSFFRDSFRLIAFIAPEDVDAEGYYTDVETRRKLLEENVKGAGLFITKTFGYAYVRKDHEFYYSRSMKLLASEYRRRMLFVRSPEELANINEWYSRIKEILGKQFESYRKKNDE